MPIGRLILPLVAVLWLWPAAAQAQSAALMEAYNQANALSDQGRYEEAIPFARKALELGEQEFGLDHPTTATLLNNLVGLYRAQGRYGEAEPLFERSLAIREQALGPDHPSVATGLNNLAGLYQTQGRYAEAEPLYRRALAIRENALGPDHPDVAQSLNNLAGLYRDQGRYGEAEPLYERALEIWEQALGPDHPEVATGLNNLAGLYDDQGKYAEAEPLYERALAIKEKALGPDHPSVATSLNNLAELYRAQGRYGEAEPPYRRALAIWENALGPDHPDVAQSLNNLAGLYRDQGRYGEAEPLYGRALAIREKALGPDHPDVAIDLNNLALLYHVQGRYAEAEPLYKRALAIFGTALGPDHPDVATGLNNLAGLYYDQGRYAEAEPLYRRALAIHEKALGPDHPDVAIDLNNLAGLYGDQGRYGEAEPLYGRALAIREKALGPEHPRVATSLSGLALLYHVQGKYAEAEPLHKRALAIREKALGPEHPHVAASLSNLARLYRVQSRYAEAEPLYERALAIDEKALGPDHPSVAIYLDNLGGLYRAQGRYAEAEPLLKRALAIREKALGPEHPHVARSLNNLAALYYVQDRYGEALAHIRRATDIHRGRALRFGGQWSSGGLSEQKSVRYVFLSHVDIATSLIEREPDRRGVLTAEAFEAGQLARATSAAAAVSRMAARFAAGDDDLARLVRARQDAIDGWRRLDQALVKAASQPPEERDVQAEARLRADLAALDRRLTGLDAELAQAFPDYAELATPEPVALADIQELLGAHEALMVYLVWDESTFLWVVRPDRAELHRIAVGADDLADAVADLRAGLDPTAISRLGEIPPFDTTKAYELYSRIFAPAEALLDGVRHLMVVPDGALQSLPVGVLVTEEPRQPVTDFSDYRQVPWLARQYAVTVLPAVSSLEALRYFAETTRATRPFIGFGDPLLEGRPRSGRGIELAALFSRGAIADVDAVRELPALPETADELAALAGALGAGDDSLFLRERAAEARVRAMDLSDYRVLAFATHGLVAGQLSGLAEPALVLTPPAEGSEGDDGLLTASEVALLKLDADWVILSACNTAAADGTPGAEGLSGLAKAFFYAGSRALLVSHWPVFSDAAVALTTRMLSEASDHSEIGRAEALRRSMLALMEDPENPHYAHPMFWAPFIVVGEGGAYTPS